VVGWVVVLLCGKMGTLISEVHSTSRRSLYTSSSIPLCWEAEMDEYKIINDARNKHP
jgi:hypothetical protein